MPNEAGGAAELKPQVELYYTPTPNGQKISIFLEEAGIPYRVHWMKLDGDQFTQEFLKISPNNRMPAIVDVSDPDAPHAVFESGAILCYLADRFRSRPSAAALFPPTDDLRRRSDALQWVFWQVGGLGPMAGQASHFVNYADKICPDADHSYARERYVKEYDRLLLVLQRRLVASPFLGGEAFGIADIVSFPWVVPYKRFLGNGALDKYPDVRRWFDYIKARPGVQRGMAIGMELYKANNATSQAAARIDPRKFNQGGANTNDASMKPKL